MFNLTAKQISANVTEANARTALLEKIVEKVNRVLSVDFGMNPAWIGLTVRNGQMVDLDGTLPHFEFPCVKRVLTIYVDQEDETYRRIKRESPCYLYV